MLAWDEILDGDPARSTTVMAWTGVKASIRSAQSGFQTIVCPISHLYFSNPGYNRLTGVTSVARVYNFEPVNESLTAEEKDRIIGVQGCIWTEWTKDSTKMEWQMMPRIAALSELQWSRPEKDLDGFLKRLRHQLNLYMLNGYHYKEDIEEVTMDINPAGDAGKALVTLSTFDNAPVYYTTDGTEPTETSSRYQEPFTIDSQTPTVKAKAIRNGRESQVVEESLEYNLATMRPVHLNSKPDDAYGYKGSSLLVDGLKGDGYYRSGRYIGIYGKDLDVTVDLEDEKEISSVSVSSCLVPGDYIFGLTGLEVHVSSDGKTYRKIASKSIPELEKGSKNNVTRLDELSFDQTKARFVRIVGKCTPVLPSWHPGAGHKTYLFIDEVGVY